MGQAKANTAAFVALHPICCYCGDDATTRDHCPPQCVFTGRAAPDDYVFPACNRCNDLFRPDDQALGFLARVNALTEPTRQENEECQKLFIGTRNNQPALAAEWAPVRAIERRKLFRESFGPAGDELRNRGMGVLTGGPLTIGVLERFSLRLTKALYYKHVREVFEGKVFHEYANFLHTAQDDDTIKMLIEFAPNFVEPTIQKRSLGDRFSYRFFAHTQPGALHAVCKFGDQLILRMVAMSDETFEGFSRYQAESGIKAQGVEFAQCRLAYPRR